LRSSLNTCKDGPRSLVPLFPKNLLNIPVFYTYGCREVKAAALPMVYNVMLVHVRRNARN
jgi:hypothetical protein